MLKRRFHDKEFTHSTAPKTACELPIRIADHPMLREVAWSTDHEAELTPHEALSLYERNWRHIDHHAMNLCERELLDYLTNTVGKGLLLV